MDSDAFPSELLNGRRASAAARPAAGDALMRAWDNDATHARDVAGKRIVAGMAKPDGLLVMYRAMNAPSEGLLTCRSDFDAALEEPSP